MRKLAAKILTILVVLVIQSPTLIFAANASYSLRPSSGYVALGQDFTIDVLIDSGGEEVMLARTVISYDPRIIKVKEVERNDGLFCDWEDNEQTVDQDKGVIVITGFCQSGNGSLYKTEGDPDVLARITFEPLKKGDTPLNFEWSGQDEEFKSVIMADGSPPQNILLNEPDSGDFTVVGSTGDSSDGDDSTNDGSTPSTSIPILENKTFVIAIGILVFTVFISLMSYLLIKVIRFRGRKLYKTQVTDEEKD